MIPNVNAESKSIPGYFFARGLIAWQGHGPFADPDGGTSWEICTLSMSQAQKNPVKMFRAETCNVARPSTIHDRIRHSIQPTILEYTLQYN
jgi:hypothetical protein